MIPITALPSINAALNALSALLLTAGYLCIRRRWVSPHRTCMVPAFVTSSVFLMSYLVLRYYAGMTTFKGQGWIRPVYFTILTSHTILAATIVPMALITLTRALRGRFATHAWIARWTLPLWLCVSITGVLVYWILYHLYPEG